MPDYEQAVVEPSSEYLAGRSMLAEAGIDQESLDRIASIQLNAGGKCVGSLAEFVGIEDHAPIRAGVVETMQKASKEDRDVVAAVEDKLDLFIKRDDQGEVVRGPSISKKK